MGAVGPTPDPVSTVQQRRLCSLAVDVVQQDQTDTLAKPAIQDYLSLTPEGGKTFVKSIQFLFPYKMLKDLVKFNTEPVWFELLLLSNITITWRET